MAIYSTIRYETDDGLLWLTLDRSDKLNAFNVTMAEELEDAYRRASSDDAVNAIVVTVAGSAFCAGMDLSGEGNVFGLNESLSPTLGDLHERPVRAELQKGVRDTGGRVALAMFECLNPIIGAIKGAAVGIGATMTLPMDIRLASTDARIGFIVARLGITPEACSTWFLPRIVGLQQTLEWFYRADMVGAAETLDKGLFRSLHSPETLVEEACTFARELIAKRSPVSIALIRQKVLRNSAAPNPRDAHEIESLAMFYTSIGDGKEGVRAFLDKRSVQFAARSSAMPDFYPWQE